MHNTEGEWTRNDITEVSDEEWQELRGTVNLVAGGTPCQSFSIAGKRLGFEDTRGTLFFYYANAIKQIQPEYFMFENVKGLLSHDKGNTIKTILKTFDEIGYAVDFDIFNSKYYGVPQNRERIFIVGKRKSNEQTYSQRDVTKGTKTIDKMRLWAKENVELISILPSNTELEVTCRLRDVLETEVDEKFYLSKEQTDRLVFNMGKREQGGGRGHYTIDEPIKVIGSTQKNATITDGSHSPTLTSAMGSGGGHVPMMVFDEPKVVEQQTVSYNRKDGIGKEIDVSHTLSASDYRGLNRNQNQNAVVEPTLEPVGNVNPSGRGMNGQVFNADGLSPTLSTNKGEGSKVLIEGLPIKEATKQGYALATDGDSVNLQYPDSKTRRGRVGNQIANTLQAGETNQGVVEVAIGASRGRNPENPSDRTVGAPTEQRLEINREGTSNTLTSVQKDNYVVSRPPFRIRKLTPLETFRLQGFPDELFYKAQEVNSNSQLYKQAGNSVTVNVIEAIANRLTNIKEDQP